jgi:hypothetical protein
VTGGVEGGVVFVAVSLMRGGGLGDGDVVELLTVFSLNGTSFLLFFFLEGRWRRVISSKTNMSRLSMRERYVSAS